MNLSDSAKRLVELLERDDLRVVFAESCTAGLVAATLAEVPGVSKWLCGSAVTYREGTKTDWLDVSADDLARHSAVSEPVAEQMANGVLQRTPEADLAASITGHLGPDAPSAQDGVVFIGLAHRAGDRTEVARVTRHQLSESTRVDRQREAAGLVVEQMMTLLDAGV